MSNPDPGTISAEIDSWFADSFSGGAVARDTPAYNQVFSALPDLKSRIVAMLPVAPAAPAAPVINPVPPEE